MSKSSENLIPESSIDTVLAKDINFKGSVKFKKSLKVKGCLDGDITSEEGFLVIGNEAKLKANIQALKVNHFGEIEGNVIAKDSLEMASKAVIKGDVSTGEIYIEKGAILHGSCSMLEYINTNSED